MYHLLYIPYCDLVGNYKQIEFHFECLHPVVQSCWWFNSSGVLESQGIVWRKLIWVSPARNSFRPWLHIYKISVDNRWTMCRLKKQQKHEKQFTWDRKQRNFIQCNPKAYKDANGRAYLHPHIIFHISKSFIYTSISFAISENH